MLQMKRNTAPSSSLALAKRQKSYPYHDSESNRLSDLSSESRRNMSALLPGTMSHKSNMDVLSISTMPRRSVRYFSKELIKTGYGCQCLVGSAFRLLVESNVL